MIGIATDGGVEIHVCIQLFIVNYDWKLNRFNFLSEPDAQ